MVGNKKKPNPVSNSSRRHVTLTNGEPERNRPLYRGGNGRNDDGLGLFPETEAQHLVGTNVARRLQSSLRVRKHLPASFVLVEVVWAEVKAVLLWMLLRPPPLARQAAAANPQLTMLHLWTSFPKYAALSPSQIRSGSVRGATKFRQREASAMKEEGRADAAGAGEGFGGNPAP